MEWIGLDIGGANIKLATPDDQFSYPFELWKHPEKLASFLAQIVPGSKEFRAAVTMTGELADGYSNRRIGVFQIIKSVEEVFPNSRYYQTTGQFADATAAGDSWLATAAANWHASASWFAHSIGLEQGFLVDIGSTTTDIVPIDRGKPAGSANTDLLRLGSGQLVYTGIRRSPLCGIVQEVEIDQHRLPVANEFFATIEDAYVVLGRLAEREGSDTADGRVQKRDEAAQRIARMVCADVDEIGMEAIVGIAEQAYQAHCESIIAGIQKVLSRYPQLERDFLVCGEGESLACDILSQLGLDRVRRLSEVVGEATTDSAAAVAVRELAERAFACGTGR